MQNHAKQRSCSKSFVQKPTSPFPVASPCLVPVFQTLTNTMDGGIDGDAIMRREVLRDMRLILNQKYKPPDQRGKSTSKAFLPEGTLDIILPKIIDQLSVTSPRGVNPTKRFEAIFGRGGGCEQSDMTTTGDTKYKIMAIMVSCQCIAQSRSALRAFWEEEEDRRDEAASLRDFRAAMVLVHAIMPPKHNKWVKLHAAGILSGYFGCSKGGAMGAAAKARDDIYVEITGQKPGKRGKKRAHEDEDDEDAAEEVKGSKRARPHRGDAELAMDPSDLLGDEFDGDDVPMDLHLQ